MDIVLIGVVMVVEAEALPLLEVVGHSITPPLLMDRVPLLQVYLLVLFNILALSIAALSSH